MPDLVQTVVMVSPSRVGPELGDSCPNTKSTVELLPAIRSVGKPVVEKEGVGKSNYKRVKIVTPE